jgi:hypothetical protein
MRKHPTRALLRSQKMRYEKTPGAMKKFIRTPWRFQQTVQTPLKDLERFVSVILTANPAKQGTVIVDEVVFDSEKINALINIAPETLGRDDSIKATDVEVAELLMASFSGWMDFLFIPAPKPFVIYSDHDEFTTFYANSKSALNHVIAPLRDAGYSVVRDWERSF